MNQVIWKDRLCIILKDGQWAMSRVGAWTDFNFAPDVPDGKEAILGNFNALITGNERLDKKGRTTIALQPLDDNRLLFIQATGDVFVMIGDPCAGGRVELLKIDNL